MTMQSHIMFKLYEESLGKGGTIMWEVFKRKLIGVALYLDVVEGT